MATFILGDIVKIANTNETDNDPFLEEGAKAIIRENNYTGEVTKVEDGIYFVGFKNESGWVTQGFKADEIVGVN